MSRTLFRYVMGLYAQYLVGVFLAVLVVFMIADFGDRLKVFVDHLWTDVALLYWNKTLVASQQLGPAAMLLAAGAGVSTLRKRGELTALDALAFRPANLYAPVAVVALAAAGGLVAFDEYVVTRASAQVDEISVSRFNSWGDWLYHHRPQQWFRVGNRIFHLRRGNASTGFEGVTILELTPEFRLASRIDADRMAHVEGGRWQLEGVVERHFSEGAAPVTQAERVVRDLEAPLRAFQIRTGRPEQMRLRELVQQIDARRRGGHATRHFILALHNRFAYPLTGFAAALVAVGLALRPGRKGHLTVALVEGLAIAVFLWALMVVGKALALGGHLPPPAAAWTPFTVLFLLALGLWLRWEGKLGRRGR